MTNIFGEVGRYLLRTRLSVTSETKPYSVCVLSVGLLCATGVLQKQGVRGK
jgi:hypothetical protein